MWIEAALDTAPRVSDYGPGFRELFATAAHATGTRPERGVFLFASVIGASIPALGFLTARAVGVSRAVAAALFLCLAIDPALIRTAHSESYFSVIVALSMAAAWAIACGGWRASPKSPAFVLGLICAGLFVAQAARVHPIAWVPSALVPLVVLLGPARQRQRLIALGAMSLGVAAVVLVATGPALWATLQGSLGDKWLRQSHPRWDVVAHHFPVLLCAVLAGFVIRGRRGVAVASVLVVAVVLGKLTDLLSEPNPAVAAASDRLLLPVVAPALAVWFQRMSQRKTEHAPFLPLVLALLGVALSAKQWSRVTERYTDVREAGYALEWRERLPAGAEVVYLERAGPRTLRLPLYERVTASRRNLSTRDALPDLSAFSGTIYYYRSSLCSTEEGASACQKLEASASLQLVAERELPAIPSMRWNPYPTTRVRVALYRRP
jgi:hypothetical protein